MKKSHRTAHHLFWYLATPLLIVLLLSILPKTSDQTTGDDNQPPAPTLSVIPQGISD